MNYKEQLEIVLSYRIREGQAYRGDCFACGGRNTFAIKLRSGELSWGCFRASCDVGGIKSGELSTIGILAKMGTEQPSVRPLAPIPTMLLD